MKTRAMLSLRVNKAFRELLRKNQEGPYKTKVEFAIATTGTFSEEKHFNTAWSNYNTTTTSTSKKPAVLYKVYDATSLTKEGIFEKIADNEDLVSNGRRYKPGEFHTWNVNAVWLLAQIHCARPFVIISQLCSDNIMRRDKPSVFSAFAKEVAVAIKIGYTVNVNDNNQIQLSLNYHPSIKKLTVADITLSEIEIKSAIKTVNHFLKPSFPAKSLHSLFADIEKYDLDELDWIQMKLNQEISQPIDNMLSNCEEKILALNSFITVFNNNLPRFATRIDTNLFTSSANDEVIVAAVAEIKKMITSSVLNRIKARVDLLQRTSELKKSSNQPQFYTHSIFANSIKLNGIESHENFQTYSSKPN